METSYGQLGDARASDATLDRHYFAFLGRAPTPEERMTDPLDAGALVERLTRSPEFRGRFRDSVRTDRNARASVGLWPPEMRQYDLQVVVVSGDPWSKSIPALEALAPGLGPREFLTILCGEPDSRPFAGYPQAEMLTFPGESVFQLRARMPALLKESVWVAVLEDHGVPMPDWLAGARRAIAATGPDTLAFTGVASNETSTLPWNWANFLFNFAYHWHPSAARELKGTVASIFFRRDLVGVTPFRLYEYEEFILGRPCPVHNDICVNHTQRTGWWAATAHVFDNGLVAGNTIRRNSDRPRRSLRRALLWSCGGRLREMSALLRAHPRYRELPPGTMARLRWISFCHGAGAVIGATFGSGRAHKRLE